METCFKIKCHLQLESYVLHDYLDGDYAEFKTNKIRDPKALMRLVGKLEVRIYSRDDELVVAVYEDFNE